MTVVDPAQLDLPLSASMRFGSRAEHEAAEGSTFMTELLAGRVDAAGYTAYLLRLRPAYAALETVVRALVDDPLVAAVRDPGLERLAAIDADLEHWSPDGPRHVASPAADAYRDRILASAGWGGLVVAHHYTRYLGDLSGGRAIGRILDRSFDLAGRGLAFYDFSAVARPKLFKDAYRARLDALDLSAADRDRVVAEVKVAFALNQSLLAELGRESDVLRR